MNSSDPSWILNMIQWLFANFWNDEISRKASCCLRLYSLVLVIGKRLKSLAAQDASFSTSASLGYYPLLFVVKKTFLGGEGAVWYPMSMYMYLKIGTTHFIVWPYIIWCLALRGLFYWNPRSSNDEWHIWWYDPIQSCHHTRGTISPYIDQLQYQYKLFIYPFHSLTGM